MNCLDCGKCCKYIHYPIRTRGDRVFWRFRGAIAFVGEYAILPFKCPQLGEDNKCKIYENRPLACRHYKKGAMLCESLSPLPRDPNPPD